MSPEERARLDQLAREDHADMLRQLGITQLRPGYDGRVAAGAPNAANYDPAKANPYPDWPDVLTLKDGQKVTTAEMWWQKRRPEIVEDFEREVYGRVPKDVPKVTWTVAETVETTVGGQPVVARRVIGHVDNSLHPAITVDIKMAVVVPVNATGPVPVLMMFGWGNMPDDPLPRFPGFPEPAAPPSTDQLIAAGWGYVSLTTSSIQADNGAGLTSGIIGLANQGKRRTPEQWGALRAWAWGAARALDYLETLPAVDATRVGIEGVSRYGKAALVTMAFEPRFAVVLVGSSGEGGAKPHRRNFGEAVENLTGSGAYHWMAGNFLKYAAEEASFGRKTANDIPVDAHQLIALCAPRPTFISYGVPEKGDAHWLDQQGSYMATVAAGPVFRLLGVRDLGVTEDYRVAKMPPVNTGLLDGELAWRQHDGGHEDRTNMSFFIAWANRLLHHTPPPVPADQPRMRADRNSHLAHQQLLAKAKSGGIDLYFLGDSITRRWGATDYPDFLAHWTEDLPRLERRQLRLGRRSDGEHPVAPLERRARRRQPEGHRAPRGHQQRRQGTRRRGQGEPTSPGASRRSSMCAGRRRRRRRSSSPPSSRATTTPPSCRPSLASTPTSRRWPTGRPSGSSTSTPGSPTPGAPCSRA